ncbi:MAG: hypothetical protein ACPGGB_06795, partial [Flavobacteriales bacterium]
MTATLTVSPGQCGGTGRPLGTATGSASAVGFGSAFCGWTGASTGPAVGFFALSGTESVGAASEAAAAAGPVAAAGAAGAS